MRRGIRSHSRSLSAVAALCFAASCFPGSTAADEQFVEQSGLLPGPVEWTEAVVPCDANEDGRLDLLFVNCNGWSRPGDMGAPSADPLPPTLLINTGTKDGAPVFEDQTAKLLPESFKIHGKDAIVCDVDGDGHDDIVFAVAFGNDQRLLRKDPVKGTFVDESSRLGKLVLNAHSVSYGDLDDDGDLDLVFPDAGPRSFRDPGGKARLLLNDGKGNFSDKSEQLGAKEKVGAQNPKIIDIDGDFDLDIVLDGKSAVTQIYLNDGNARFTLDSATIPECTGRPYEIEWGDLDGDGDLDAVFMNFAGERRRSFQNAVLRNHLVETGKIAFTGGADAFDGNNLQDENDFALLDADDDGDLDVVVAVLPMIPGPEKLFINGGTIGPAFLKETKDAFTPFVDGTLDVDVGDFDGDGRYDVVTAQGENKKIESYANRYYKNVGPKDSRAPTIGRVSTLPSKISLSDLNEGKVIVKAWIQDATFDDGITFARARLRWAIIGASTAASGDIPMTHVGGGIHRGVLRPKVASGSLKGAQIGIGIAATDPAGNESRSPAMGFLVQ